MSLKEKLYNLIRDRGQVSYSEMIDFVQEEGYKVVTGDREMRHLTEKVEGEPDPDIKKIFKTSKRGNEYVAGYIFSSEKPQKKPFWVRDSDGKLEFGGYR